MASRFLTKTEVSPLPSTRCVQEARFSAYTDMELTDYIKYCLGYIKLTRRKALSEQQKHSVAIPKEHFSLLGLLNGDLDGNVAEPILFNTFYALDPKNIPAERKEQYEQEKQLANKIEDIYNAYRNDQFYKAGHPQFWIF